MDCSGIPELGPGESPWGPTRGYRPHSAALEVTQRCNNLCTHCYLDPARRRPVDDLPLDFWVELLHALHAEETLFIGFTGGEPLLRADFPDLYETAKRMGFVVTILTNGRLVDEDTIDLFRRLPPRAVSVSIYGASQAAYEQVSRVPGSFEQAMRGIHRLHEAGVALLLKTMLLRSNSHELPQMCALAESLGTTLMFDGAVTCAVDGSSEVLAERLDPQALVDIEFTNPQMRERHMQRWLDAQTCVRNDCLYSCNAGRWNLYVDAAGSVLPCSSARLHSWPLDRADVRGSVHRVFYEEIPAAIRARVPGPFPCGECAIRALCPSCAGARELEVGSATLPCEFGCEVARLRFERAGRERSAEASLAGPEPPQ